MANLKKADMRSARRGKILRQERTIPLAAPVPAGLGVPLQVRADQPGWHVLRVRLTGGALPLLRVGIARGGEEPKTFVLPALRDTDYLVRLSRGSVRFSFEGADVSAVSIRRGGPLDRLRALERAYAIPWLRLEVDDHLGIQPMLRGTGKTGRTLAKAMRELTYAGFGLASADLHRTPELLTDASTWVAPAAPLPRIVARPKFVLALHLFYEELWPEFRHFLLRIDVPFDLIITTPASEPTFATDARRLFPGAQLVTVPNRGRDVGPFVHLLNEGRLDGAELVLKLHGKRTALTSYHATRGHIWRRANLIDLAGTGETVGNIIARFSEDPSIGMIGSPRFRLPGHLTTETAAWGSNRTTTLALAERLGIDQQACRLDFFAGTMFWVRRETLEPLRRLNLTLGDFPTEVGQPDGELQHALERLFGMLPGLAGQRLDGATAQIDPAI